VNLDSITPAILTLDEEPNIGRLLERLRWAARIIVVDSGSSDRTMEIATSFPNVVFVENRFESHSKQWNFARSLVKTPWVLELDADHIPSDDFEAALRTLEPSAHSAFKAHFRYSIFGRPLRGSLFPDLPVLFLNDRVEIHQDGHANQLKVTGTIGMLPAVIHHDDRKTSARFVANQLKYMALERMKLSDPKSRLSIADRLRTKHVVAPMLAFFYVLFVKRAILDGRHGWYYAYQRLLAETILALELLDQKLRKSADRSDGPES
jgi:glycosyltransferase involved in cell wall biosynthesis